MYSATFCKLTFLAYGSSGAWLHASDSGVNRDVKAVRVAPSMGPDGPVGDQRADAGSGGSAEFDTTCRTHRKCHILLTVRTAGSGPSTLAEKAAHNGLRADSFLSSAAGCDDHCRPRALSVPSLAGRAHGPQAVIPYVVVLSMHLPHI